MLYNIYFEAAAMAFMIVINVYIRLQYNSNSVYNRQFKRLALTLLIAIALDLITAVTISYATLVPIPLNMVLKYLYFAADTVLEYQFVQYSVLCVLKKPKSLVINISKGILLFSLALLTVNFLTNWIFSFSETEGYIHGPIYPVVHIIPILTIIAVLAILYSGYKNYSKSQRGCVIAYTVSVVSGPIVQIIFPDILFILFSIALGFLTLLFSMETPDYQELIKTMDELRVARDKAQEAEKARAKFLTAMSHEIRTPINAIIGSAEAILSSPDDESTIRYTGNVLTGSRRLLTMMNDIMSYTEMASGDFKLEESVYDTSMFLMDILSSGEYYTEKNNLEFKTVISGDIPSELYGDCQRLTQIIDNLLSNAANFTEKGYVELTLEWRNIGNDMGELFVAVRDTGIGIKENDISMISSSFLRIDREHTENKGGVGLGLTIVTCLLNYMDSSLKVESNYGEGTTMSFSLIQKISDSTPMGDVSAIDNKNLKNNIGYIAPDAHILAVDDNKINLEIICRCFAKTKASVDTANNGKEAVELVRKTHYDAIFLDHMMPVMDGIEAMKIIRSEKLCPDTPIIVVTANVVSGEREMYLESGFDDYVSKPVTEKRLCDTLKKHLAKNLIISTDSFPEEPAVPEDAKTEENSGIKEKLSFLNTEMGLAYCCDDEDFYLQIITDFLENNKTEAINDAFREKDTENYRILVHSLKGTSRTIGADELSDFALKLEMASRSDDWDFIENNNAQFLDEYNGLIKRIQSALSMVH